jgi:hypothetical protein
MIQIFDAHCQNCSLGDWVSISEADLSMLIDGGNMLISCIKFHGVMGLVNWIEALKKKISDFTGLQRHMVGPHPLKLSNIKL